MSFNSQEMVLNLPALLGDANVGDMQAAESSCNAAAEYQHMPASATPGCCSLAYGLLDVAKRTAPILRLKANSILEKDDRFERNIYIGLNGIKILLEWQIPAVV
ncbi:hypothetical protein R1flu_022034 [Riccia fluitans]|uniref:Uncharacterized protein n=1 Tax=Riccia fluitans TaxID=41844 RepID=A0ABD1ZSK5_9MARC